MALLKTHTYNYTDLYKLKLWVLLAGDVPAAETQDRCPLSCICVITFPSQSRHQTTTDQSGTGLFLQCAWAQVREEQLCQPTAQMSMWMCLSKASRALLPCHMKWPSWDQQVLEIATPPVPFWPRVCRHRHEMVNLHPGSPGMHWPSRAQRNLVKVTVY